MKFDFALFFFWAFLGNTLIAQQQDSHPVKPFVIGEIFEIESDYLSESRTINIYLPPYYQEDSLKKYPVLYLLDGSANEDFVHIAGLVQFATFPWIQMMPETIVVGIANTDRKRDFTFPTNNEKDKVEFPTTGGSARFIKFIEEELQPAIEKRYRCTKEKTILGQSLGGLLATEILFKRPALFNKYLIVSPSLWWDDQSLLKLNPKILSTIDVFISVGNEGELMINDAKKLKEKISHAHFHFLENQDHGNILHLAAYEGLKILFAK